ncbi:MAG: hypothetical protein JW936_01265 [Sedimentisphaerales bacterium]|nr:hypothetical protein [Sedimentisphaerales bacterium]
MTNEILLKADDRASRKIRGVGDSVGGLTRSLKAALGAAAAYFSLRAVRNFAAGSIAAYNQQEAAVTQLTTSLENLNAAADMPRMQDFASDIQAVTTEGDEATLSLMALGASLGHMSGDTLQAATVAALGFSRSLGVDTRTAMTMVAKAAQGNMTTFSRYGIQLDQNMSQQEQFQAILRQGADAFNLVTAEADTHQGRMMQLSNAWGDYKEQIGESIANMIDAIIPFERLKDVITNWKDYVDLAFFGAGLTILGWVEDVKYWFSTTIPAYLSWLGRNWYRIFVDIGRGVATVVTNMWNNIRNFFSAVWSWLSGDGWDFEWTSLTEGFKSSLEELPRIAERAMTDTERYMSDSMDDIRQTIAERMAGEVAGPDIAASVADSIANAQMSTATESAAGGGGGAAGNVGNLPNESRFLTMRTGSPVNQTAQNTARTVTLLSQVVALLRQQLPGPAGGVAASAAGAMIVSNMI